MKRVLCLILTVLLICSLAACQTRVPEEKDPPAADKTPPTAAELWQKAEDLQGGYTSEVYTMTGSIAASVGDLSYRTDTSMTVEGFDLQGDNPSYRVTNKQFGVEEQYTYVGG
ncbi:MAG: hypothetical protein J6R77_04480, partial [Clostridia bacterium]|nr:hypothetical protein [Clostridia bacterium]